MGGLVLHQLAREGAPMIRGLLGEGMLDLKTMVSLFFTPDMGTLGWSVAKRSGLPLFGTAGTSDSKIFDGQATAETAAELMYNSLFGANLIHDVGYLDSAMTYSFELLTTCNEVIGWIRRFLTPAVIDEETLALDLIHEAGVKNIDFLNQRHTARHLKETWTSKLFDRMTYANWSKNGSQTLEQRAREKVRNILHNHTPEPLDSNIKKRLRLHNLRHVFASTSAVAVDCAMCAVMGMKPEDILHLRAARDMGLGSLGDFEMVGELPVAPEYIRSPGFDGITPLRKIFLSTNQLRDACRTAPKLTKERCVKCGECLRQCPTGTLAADGDDFPTVTAAPCASCHACQEVCDRKAMFLDVPDDFSSDQSLFPTFDSPSVMR